MSETQEEQNAPETGQTGPLEIPTPARETDEDAVTGPTTIPDDDPEGPGETEPIEGDDDEDGQADEEQEPESLGDYAPGVAEARLLSERELDKRFKALDKENERHWNRVQTIFDDEAALLVPCPVCMDGPHGFIFDPSQVPLQPEAHDRTMQMLGLSNFSDTPQASWAVTCETCQGYGEVRTGSKRQGRETTGCLDCNEAGWINIHQKPSSNGHTEATIPTTTGPTVYGHDEPDPAIQRLIEQGYMVVPPTVLPTAS